MVAELEELNTQVVLLSGDNANAAAYVGAQLGISQVYAELLPEQKMAAIKQLQASGRKVGMIGDGINDALALKSAHVGVAMGSMGSDMANEAADIALMGDDIGKIPYLKKLANLTIKNIKFNIALAMGINFVAISLSIAGLLNPVSGALVHNAGSVLVVLNAALLYERKIISGPLTGKEPLNAAAG